MIHRPCPMIGWSLVSSRLFSEQGACRRLRRQRRLDAIAQTARAVTVMSAAMGSITGARQMTMTAISHIQGRPCGPLLPMRMCCAFRSGRAATGAAASPGGCRAVGFRPCYKTSIDDANRIG